MRLREIQKIIEKNLPKLYDTTSDYDTVSATHKIAKYSENFIAIHNIERLGFIDPEYSKLFEDNLLVNSPKNSHIVFTDKNNTLYFKQLNRIIWKSEACLDLIIQNLHSEQEDKNSLVISLPDRELPFNEFNDIVETLNDNLRLLTIIPEFQSEIKLSNFDVGSEWFVLSFLTDKAVKLFGRLISIIQRTQVGMKQTKALDAHLETLDLDDKTLSDFKEATAKANAKINEDLAKRFLEEENLDSTGEILNQMTKVIENTDKLMNIGVGFEAAITATNEVAKTFPPLAEQKKLDKIKSLDSIKQIEEQPEKKTKPEEKED